MMVKGWYVRSLIALALVQVSVVHVALVLRQHAGPFTDPFRPAQLRAKRVPLAPGCAVLGRPPDPDVDGRARDRAHGLAGRGELAVQLVDGPVGDPSGYVIIHADGTVSGAFGKGGKDKLTGRWTWETVATSVVVPPSEV